MKIHFPSSVRSKMILLGLLAFFPVVLLMFFNFWYQRNSQVADAERRIERVLSFAVLHEEETVEETRRILATLTEVPDVIEGGEAASNFLRGVLKNSPGYANFGIIRRDGQVTASALPFKPPLDLSDRSYFQDALKNRSFSIGRYQQGRITGTPVVNFGYPILGRWGEVTAILFAALDLSYIRKFEAEVDAQTPGGSQYVRLDRHGVVLGSYPESKLFGRGHSLGKTLFEKISKEKRGMFVETGVDGTERLYVFSPVSGPISKEGGYALLGVSTRALFAEANRLLVTNLMVLAGVAGLYLVLMRFFGRTLFVRPVSVLVGASKRIAAGDFSVRAALPESSGEIGELGRAFDEMAEQVERKEKEAKTAQDQIGKGLHMLSALREVDQSILRGASVHETFGIVSDTILAMGYRFCWVGLLNPDHSVHVTAVRGWEDRKAFAEASIRWDDTQQGQGPTRMVFRTGEKFVSQDILRDDRFEPWKGMLVEQGFGSLLSLPLKQEEGGVLGVLHVGSGHENGFSEEDIHGLETFAQQCAVALLSARAIENLRDANQRLMFHFNRMPLGYIVWDKDFHVVEWNPAAERIFGWEASEALGRHPYEFIVPEDVRAHVDKTWSKLMEGDEAGYTLNANSRKDGKRITCEWFYSPLRDAAGEVAGVLSMVHDSTEKTELERQLQTAQRMEAIGTLAGGIAHDFNNALTGIFGFAEMLQLELAGNERALSDLNEILRCSERASTLTRQLLTYSRRQIIEPTNLNLNGVITDLVKLVSKVAGEHIEIRTLLAKDLPTIRADVGQLEQVVMNLVLNARDAMPGGGKLLIETEVADLDAEYVRSHPYMQVGSYVRLTVSDTGIGMDAKTRERVFEPFFTTKSPDKGTGLGLAVVYGIVKQHEGFIHLYSEPGRGTTFKVYFPPVEALPDVIQARGPSEIRGGTETILLAEDDESVRMFVERTLMKLGYTVLTARNGKDAIALFEKNRDRIALALLDVVMPLMGGKEAYEAMHKEKSALKVVFTSGYTANAVHESFVLIAGVPFLSKPFSTATLARKVREVLDKA